MNKVIEIEKAIQYVKSGDTVLIGGFSNIGCPVNLVYELAKHSEINALTTVSEDFSYSGLSFIQGPEALLVNGQLKKVVVSFLGNAAVEKAYYDGRIELEFIPQGTLAERLRAAGAGLGGFYTPTGVGTELEQNREVRELDGKKYLFEKPLKGNVALIKAYKADRFGNCIFKLTAENFNVCMAMAADTVILETENLVEPGELEPDAIHLPGIFVDHVVVKEGASF